ncbi:MAG: hypothetical protein IKT87_07380 [Bacteroidaceae bacterium]|nr:hypothetical protein [Bacteroidaceae bacterium]
MEFSEILNYILGGGLLAAVVGIVTLKATLRKANADAEKAIAEAETVRIDNAEHATRILIENIVEPLRKELHETREELRETKKEFGATKREMARLRKAIADANSCKHSDDCPVLYRLRDLTKGELPGCIEHGPGIRGQPTIRSKEDRDGDGTTITGDSGDTDRQPP